MKKVKKLIYSPPTIDTFSIFIEKSIVVGSALVRPVDANQQASDEWDVDPDVERTYTW
ncbi:hypothetical protein [Sphingobacterium deserti]|uniref:Uncharacterized protein n=1 Tax=Sphingobacterium deserti TaxID=1229276 RepID=A0A0B8T1Y2_9SPHI|nr:hypothetical protein [Sphingobacterium deserti]KGE12748.1 hypothetical protein DI53_3487 [Sphingobacterium deserti]